MQRRALLRLGGAISVLASAAVTGCGGSDGAQTAHLRADVRNLHYDDAGNAIEWSPENNWVRFYDSSNQLKWTFDGAGTPVGTLNWPSGAVALGERIYVADFGNSRIIVLDRQGALLAQFGEAGPDRDDFSFVHEPVVGPDQLLYFCDPLHHRVQVFDGNGQWQRSMGQFGTEGEGLNYPESMAFDAEGLLHVVDSGNGRVVVFTRQGEVVRTYGALGSQPGQMLNPEGIAIDRSGYVYVSDRGQHLVQVYDGQGQFKERAAVFLSNGAPAVPGEMCWRPDGMLHVTAMPDASKGLISRQYL